ncbi:MAG: class I SAM-dependent methyltransferase [Clostridia bacterium]|nr:class I SAM-dependent methyltransferase [Clostridia bacterium]
MADHYYTAEPASESRPVRIEQQMFGQKFVFTTDHGVFSRDGVDPGTALLAKSVPPLSGRVLDLGCGWGALGIPLAKINPGAHFVLSDVNRRAVQLARDNARANGLSNLEVVESDGFGQIEGSFDAILSNPPIRAGKQVLLSLFAEAYARLSAGGSLYLVIRTQQGAASYLRFLQALSPAASVIARGGGYRILHLRKEER